MKSEQERAEEGRITDRKDQDHVTDPQSNEISGNVFEKLAKAFDPTPGDEDTTSQQRSEERGDKL